MKVEEKNGIILIDGMDVIGKLKEYEKENRMLHQALVNIKAELECLEKEEQND